MLSAGIVKSLFCVRKETVKLRISLHACTNTMDNSFCSVMVAAKLYILNILQREQTVLQMIK